MKRILFTVLIWTAMSAMVWASDNVPKITVTGEAVVKVVPDKVSILLGVETWDKEIQTAKRLNNDILRKTIEAIKKAGVKEKNIQTDHLSIEPRYKHEYRKEEFIGYVVRNSISVTLTDPKKVEELITGVLNAGVTHIHGINFETTEFKKHREKARQLALLAAREKAEKMADVLDADIGDPLQINETRQYGRWSWYGGGWGHRGRNGMSQNTIQNVGGQGNSISDTIALGKISIRGGVTVTFELD